MRIGIMLRAFDEKGGVGVYTRNITTQLIAHGPQHEFFLYFISRDHFDEFADQPNVQVRAVAAPGKALWDQIAMPIRFLLDKLDVIFHPKFTVPLLCRGRSVMVLHGAGWFIPETRHFWSRTTRAYARVMMPMYCRSAGAVIAVSEITRDIFIDRLGVRPDKVTALYFAPSPQFKMQYSPGRITEIRQKYDLPDKFILTISGGDRDDRKNFANILESFRLIHAEMPLKLVVAGRGCEQFRERYNIPAHGYGRDILFPGWVEQMDLPAFYQTAALFLYPSNMEAHPIPITEALACGTPIVTSKIYGLKELAGDAALLVDPSRPAEVAGAAIDLLRDEDKRQELRSKALARSELFDWGHCARKTLEILERVGSA